jgi:16S rRNA C967 or C1407 C5-methylase (RsmB/RsmF family)
MIYSTCSLEREENEEVIDRALEGKGQDFASLTAVSSFSVFSKVESSFGTTFLRSRVARISGHCLGFIRAMDSSPRSWKRSECARSSARK